MNIRAANPIRLSVVMLVLGSFYLWWPDVAGPSLFCFMPIVFLVVASRVEACSRRIAGLQHRLR